MGLRHEPFVQGTFLICWSWRNAGFCRSVSPWPLKKDNQKSSSQLNKFNPMTLSHPRSSGKPSGEAECVVLRIDLGTSHRLKSGLDPTARGAFPCIARSQKVEDVTTVGAILRGEARAGSGKRERSSVLGSGMRIRGGTVTKRGQDLFPAWRGAFDSSRPSLVGLDSDHVIDALEGGLMTENELKGLLYLIREPEADVDSRVFWSANLRGLLYVFASQQVNSLRAYAQQEFITLVNHDVTIDHSTTLDSEPLSQCEPVTPGNVDKSVQLDKSDGEECLTPSPVNSG
ncbi:hypothetical protein JOM56_012475 [Amanita muscaria]